MSNQPNARPKETTRQDRDGTRKETRPAASTPRPVLPGPQASHRLRLRAVATPGVLTLPPHSRVTDAITALEAP